jgi:hypothetical protein
MALRDPMFRSLRAHRSLLLVGTVVFNRVEAGRTSTASILGDQPGDGGLW